MLSEVRAYWEGLRTPDTLPRRDQIDPRGIAGALEQVFLVERIAPGLARFRLAGMGVSEVLGMDVRGMPLSAVFDPGARGRLSPALETVFRDHVVLDLWLEAERGLGRPALAARMLLLPLVSTRGLTDLALGCLALDGEIGRVPRRFEISALLSETLQVSPRQGRDMGASHKARHHEHSGFAERASSYSLPLHAAPSSTPPRPPRGKPQLRLVKND